MALAQTQLLAVKSATAFGTAAYSPAAFTASAGTVLFVRVSGATNNVGAMSGLTISDNGSRTWNLWSPGMIHSGSVSFDVFGAYYWALSGAGGSVTLTFDATPSIFQWNVRVVEFSGADTAAFLGATASGSGTNDQGAETLTLSGTPAATSFTYGHVATSTNADSTVSEGSGFTQAYESQVGGDIMAADEYDDTSPGNTVTWTDLCVGSTIDGNGWVALGVEIKAAAGGAVDDVKWKPWLRTPAPQRGRAYRPSLSRRSELPYPFHREIINANDLSISAQPAAGTGAAFNATVAIEATPAAAAGTGTAFAPTWSLAAPAATGTGTASNPTTSSAQSAGSAVGTGAVTNPKASAALTSGTASGSGSANPPGTGFTPSAATATGAVTAPTPSSSTAPTVATGTGTANTPAPKASLAPSTATGAGTAFGPSWTLAAPVATAAGTIINPTTAIRVTPTTATGIGTANNPGVSGGGAIHAQRADATGAASSPTTSIGTAPTAGTGSGTANGGSTGGAGLAGVATGSGVASAPALAAALPAPLATATVTTYSPAHFGAATPTTALGVGAAYNPSAGGPAEPVVIDLTFSQTVSVGLTFSNRASSALTFSETKAAVLA